MGRSSPVDEERHQAALARCVDAERPPLEQLTIWPPTASLPRHSQIETHSAGPLRQGLEIVGLHCPGKKTWPSHLVQFEAARSRRGRLVGIRRDDLDVAIGVEADQRVV